MHVCLLIILTILDEKKKRNIIALITSRKKLQQLNVDSFDQFGKRRKNILFILKDCLIMQLAYTYKE